MVAFDGSESCGGAEVFYHDFLDDEDNPDVPQAVRKHIQQCEYCQRRLERLREMLSPVDDGSSSCPSRNDHRLVAELQSHFELLGEPLSCGRVKQFLPSLLMKAAKVRIPTPVTVHVDQCAACADDLESLRALELDDEQLTRLSRLYADSAATGLWTCLRAQSRLAGDWSGSLATVEADVLDHLCVCSRCRNRLYQQRQRLLEREGCDSSGPEGVRCGGISLADLFDFVVPYGRIGPFRETDWSRRCDAHLRSCPGCLAKAQHLHRTVYDVVERPDSGVVTVCTTVVEGRSPAEEESNYEGYPIDVQVLSRDPERAGGTASWHRPVARLRPFFKPAIMAAAMIPLVAIFLISVPAASGLNGRQIMGIVSQAPAVHVRICEGGTAVARQELWASSDEGILISETARRYEVYDFARQRATVRRRINETWSVPETGSVDMAAARRYMDGLLGLSPTLFSLDKELDRLPDDAPAQGGAVVEVYELPGQVLDSGGIARSCQWKVHMDPATGQPVKTEFLRWDSVEGGLVVEEVRHFDYPSVEEIRERARTAPPSN